MLNMLHTYSKSWNWYYIYCPLALLNITRIRLCIDWMFNACLYTSRANSYGNIFSVSVSRVDYTACTDRLYTVHVCIWPLLHDRIGCTCMSYIKDTDNKYQIRLIYSYEHLEKFWVERNRLSLSITFATFPCL